MRVKAGTSFGDSMRQQLSLRAYNVFGFEAWNYELVTSTSGNQRLFYQVVMKVYQILARLSLAHGRDAPTSSIIRLSSLINLPLCTLSSKRSPRRSVLQPFADGRADEYLLRTGNLIFVSQETPVL
jgi:hypothetical protein